MREASNPALKTQAMALLTYSWIARELRRAKVEGSYHGACAEPVLWDVRRSFYEHGQGKLDSGGAVGNYYSHLYRNSHNQDLSRLLADSIGRAMGLDGKALGAALFSNPQGYYFMVFEPDVRAPERIEDTVEIGVKSGLWLTTWRRHVGTPELARAVLLLL